MENFVDILKTILTFASGFLALVSLLIMFVKPIREKVLGFKKRESAEQESIKCLLRSDIVRFYFSKRRICRLHQYEFENIAMLYSAYKEMGGNSFVDKIWEEIQTWEIIP